MMSDSGQINVDEEMTENQWFVPEPSFVMNKTHFKDSKEAIELIANAPSIDWRKWIFSNEVNDIYLMIKINKSKPNIVS